MIRAIASLALTALLTLAALGNYWFTFGLWPRSWVAFVGFFLLSALLTVALQLVQKSER
jgi:hypothetical protein